MSSQDFPGSGFADDEYPAEDYDSTVYPTDDSVVGEVTFPEDETSVQSDLESMTIAQLRQHAADWDIDLGGAKKQGEILRIIRRAMDLDQVDDEPVTEPVDNTFDLSSLYVHMPPAFTEKLTKALHARGLVQPGDYFKPNAAELFRSAMLSVIKNDFRSAQKLARTVWVRDAGRKRGVK